MTTDTYKVTYDAAGFADDAKDALEALVDKFGLPRVLDLLTNVCEEKAQHLEETWQDRAAAKTWNRASDLLLFPSRRIRTHLEEYYGKMS